MDGTRETPPRRFFFVGTCPCRHHQKELSGLVAASVLARRDLETLGSLVSVSLSTPSSRRAGRSSSSGARPMQARASVRFQWPRRITASIACECSLRERVQIEHANASFVAFHATQNIGDAKPQGNRSRPQIQGCWQSGGSLDVCTE